MRVQTRQPTKISSQLHPLAEVLARRDFRRNGETAYGEIGEVAFTGGYLIEFDVIIHTPHNAIVFGSSLDSNNFFVVFADGKVRFRDSGGNTVESLMGAFTFGQIHTIRLEKNNSTVVAKINGMQVFSGLSSDSLVFDLLYKYNSGFNLKGLLANIKAWDTSSGSELVVDMPLTKYLPNPNIIENRAKPLGANSIVNLDTDDASTGWKISDGTARSITGDEITFEAQSNYQNYHQYVDVEPNKTYKVSANKLVGGTYIKAVIFDGTSTGSPRIASVGLVNGGNEFIFTPTVNTVMVYFEALTGSTTVKGISCCKAEGWGQYINPLDEDWGNGPFELQWNGDWLGAGLFGPTQIHSSWGENSDGSYTKNSNSWGYLGEAPGNINRAMIVRVKYEIENHQGQMRLYTRSADNTYNLTKDLILDRATVDINVVNHGMWLDSDNSKDTTVKITSMKEVLKSA